MSSGTNFNRKNATFTDSLGHMLGWLTEVQSQICVHAPAVHTPFQDSSLLMHSILQQQWHHYPLSSLLWTQYPWLEGFFPDLSLCKELTFLPYLTQLLKLLLHQIPSQNVSPQLQTVFWPQILEALVFFLTLSNNVEKVDYRTQSRSWELATSVPTKLHPVIISCYNTLCEKNGSNFITSEAFSFRSKTWTVAMEASLVFVTYRTRPQMVKVVTSQS